MGYFPPPKSGSAVIARSDNDEAISYTGHEITTSSAVERTPRNDLKNGDRHGLPPSR